MTPPSHPADHASAGLSRAHQVIQLHLVVQNVSPITINAAQTGLHFFFDITLGRAEVTGKMRSVRVPQRLPVILTREEATRLIDSARNLKHRAALSVPMAQGFAPAKWWLHCQ